MLKDSRTGLTIGNFLRLSAVALSDLFFVLPINVYLLYYCVSNYHPWVSWSYSHANFGTIYRFDATYIAREPGNTLLYAWITKWLLPLAAIVVFAFFGITQEALSDYAVLLQRILSCVKGSSHTDMVSK